MTVEPVHTGLELLRNTPLFAGVPTDELADLAERLTERAYQRGDTVWEAGDPGEELLVVASGSLAVVGRDSDGTELEVGRVGPGECVGEMALILDAPRSAKVVCAHTTKVFVLGKDDFRRFVREEPLAMASLVELVSRRAVELAQRRPVALAPVVVGVVADDGVRGASLVARAVAQLAGPVLGWEALLVRCGDAGVSLGSLADTGGLADRLERDGSGLHSLDIAVDGPIGHPHLGDGALAEGVSALLNAFGNRFRLVVVDLPVMNGQGVDIAISACEKVIRISATPDAVPGTQVLQVVNPYPSVVTPAPLNHCEPFVLPSEPALAAAMSEGGPLPLADATVQATRVLQRLVRKLAGVTVGVAFGGGGAFGIAHVGVLQALAEASIPVDLVAGTSMGSIVAIGAAGGAQPLEMIEITKRMGNLRTSLSALDPSFSGTGLLSGRRMVSIFSPLMPIETFDDLALPCRVVAMDVETGARVDIAEGRIDTAFRASCSIPLIFNPVRLEGRTLVDGGMVDPVPADVVKDMGADIVIAINVVPELKPGTTTGISRAFKRINRLNPLSYVNGSRNMPDIVDVFMNSLQAIQFELGNFKSLVADVLINVDLAEFTWIDFHRGLDIIERGRVAGQAVVPDIRAAFDSRLSPTI